MDTNVQLEVDLPKLAGAYFDSDFYCTKYAITGSREELLNHFLTVGWIQGRDPSADFSVLNYLMRNDDVLRRHLNPLVHYVMSGKEEGRAVSPSVDDYKIYLPWDEQVADLLPVWFDEEFYILMNPDLRGSPCALAQFLVLGWIEGRDPSPAFSTHKYLWKYNDVWLAGENPLIHYLRVGRSEGREAIVAEGSRQKVPRNLSEAEWLDLMRAEFDCDFYARTYPSLKNLSDLFGHYCSTGWLEGRDPSERFSVRKYLTAHTDVRDSGREPLFHWIRHGKFEGRSRFPSEALPEPDLTSGPSERVDEDTLVEAEFDDAFYLESYPELASVQDRFEHYMNIGWREGRNPSTDFDTSFYIANEGDIRGAGINPFRHFVLHGRREGRKGIHRVPKIVSLADYPLVTAIIPNYNHARFLPERLKSITDQNYPNLELLILDDCSTDGSREVISDFAALYDGPCKVVFNETNSGNVFAQWQKGLSLAKGDLIWICESDDTCDKDFLKQIVYLFGDESVRIAFGDIQFVNSSGQVMPGMDHLRESAAPGLWNNINVMPAARWFTGPLAIRNLIANVGGAVFRKPSFGQDVWDTARGFRVAGDWYLYLMLAGGGQIAYAPDAKAYFRQHTLNTSVTAFEKASFYEELERFHIKLRNTWTIPLKVTLSFYGNLLETFELSQLSKQIQIGEIVSLERMLRASKRRTHVAVAFLNFNIGGGEIFPVELANLLHARGFMVSAVVQNAVSDNTFLRGWLHPDIPVYASDQVVLPGHALARDAGFDVIHSHNIWAEFYFLSKPIEHKFKYVATLHGSYEVSHVERHQIASFIDRVAWAYLADRNLQKFTHFGFDTSAFRLIPNGMARRRSPIPVTRADLGVSATSFVYLFAARSHPEKGWLPAAKAFDQLCQATDREMTLIMAGAGSEPDAIKEAFSHNTRIKFLGFRSDIDDLLELSNVMLLPTRFSGESMPLTLIQSIMACVPIISTKVGQIEGMLSCDSGAVGVAIDAMGDEEAFVSLLLAAMRNALDGNLATNQKAFAELSVRFSLETCMTRYLELYGVERNQPADPELEQSPTKSTRTSKRRAARSVATQHAAALKLLQSQPVSASPVVVADEITIMTRKSSDGVRQTT